MKLLSLTCIGGAIALVISSISPSAQATSAQATSAQATSAQATVARVRDLEPRQSAQQLQPSDRPDPADQLAQATDPAPAATPSTPAPRSRSGFYGAVSTDARFVTNATLDPINASISISPGFGINTALGYRFPNNIRLEGEFSYGTNNVDEARLPAIPGTSTTISTAVPLTTSVPLTTPVPIPIPGIGIIPAGATIPAGVVLNPDLTLANPVTVAGFTIPAGTNLSTVPGFATTGGGTQSTVVTTPGIPATTVKVGGRITTLSGLFNVYYDIPTGTRFEPYVGGGVGISSASANDLSASYPGTTLRYNLSGSSTAFVYQLRGGVAYNISPEAAVTLGYRYFNVAKQSFDADPFGELDIDGLGVHNIELGFRYFF